jgi:hypothetical protein
MNRRLGVLSVVLGAAAIVYACGGSTTTNIDGGGGDSGGNDSGGNDTGGNDTGGGDTGGGDAGCGDGGCKSFVGSCDAGCPTNSVCVTKSTGLGNSQECYPLPVCGCPGGGTVCDCIGKCACGSVSMCTGSSGGGIYCQGPISRREYKTDIDYLDDAERAALAHEALSTRLAEYRYKTEPETQKRHLGFIIDDMPLQSSAVEPDRTHVDLYGYTSMLLATVQQQQKQIDDLKKQVDALSPKKK